MYGNLRLMSVNLVKRQTKDSFINFYNCLKTQFNNCVKTHDRYTTQYVIYVRYNKKNCLKIIVKNGLKNKMNNKIGYF